MTSPCSDGSASGLLSLLRSWWRDDRIRVSARPGRLLRLAPGSALRVRGVPAIILCRRVGETPAGAYVAYDCDTAGGPGELVVRHAQGRVRPSAAWTSAGATAEVPADEIDAFPVRVGNRMRTLRP